MAAKRIRVNTVNPSPIDTPMIAAIETMRGIGGRNDHPLARATPLGRYGTPEEVGQMMPFLASDDSSFLHRRCLHGRWRGLGRPSGWCSAIELPWADKRF